MAGLRGTKNLDRSRETDTTVATNNNNSSLLELLEEGESAYG